MVSSVDVKDCDCFSKLEGTPFYKNAINKCVYYPFDEYFLSYEMVWDPTDVCYKYVVSFQRNDLKMFFMTYDELRILDIHNNVKSAEIISDRDEAWTLFMKMYHDLVKID